MASCMVRRVMRYGFLYHKSVTKRRHRYLGRLTQVAGTTVQHFGSNTDNGYEKPGETHFGFESVSEEEKQGRVNQVFENVAEKYDVMNDFMSGGIHRYWKDKFILQMGPPAGTKLLDVGGGTGDIAFRFLQYISEEKKGSNFSSTESEIPEIEYNPGVVDPMADSFNSLENVTSGQSESFSDSDHFNMNSLWAGSHVTVCDINQAMLDVGKKRAEQQGYKQGVSWLRANAENLPVPSNSYDLYSIAFCIRNVTHITKVLEEAYRVLKPGGRFMCLEFSQVTNSVLAEIYDAYSFQVIPVIGQVVAGDWKSYQYLVESIRKFPSQEEFADMIRDAGFCAVTYENLLFGVSAIHSGFKL